MSHYHIEYAIRSVSAFIPSFIPADDKTQVFNLGYGRLKLWRVTNDLVWCGFVLPNKHDPELKNLLHLTPEELTCKSHQENMPCDNCGRLVPYYDIQQDNADQPMYLCPNCWSNPKV
jgi:hypothetical protein